MDYIELNKIILKDEMIRNMPEEQITAFKLYRLNYNHLYKNEEVIIRYDLGLNERYGNNAFVRGMKHGKQIIEYFLENQFRIKYSGFNYTIAMVDWWAMVRDRGLDNKCNKELISWLL